MSAFYDQLALTAARLLKDKGQVVTLRQVAKGTYDVTQASVTAAPDVDVLRNAAIFEFGEGTSHERGTLILNGDKKALMEPGIEPTVRDRLVVGGTIFKIVSVAELSPGGTPVMYELHIRL